MLPCHESEFTMIRLEKAMEDSIDTSTPRTKDVQITARLIGKCWLIRQSY
jgi:hypothetical protein